MKENMTSLHKIQTACQGTMTQRVNYLEDEKKYDVTKSTSNSLWPTA